jgi:RNA recognition motif-containing protein
MEAKLYVGNMSYATTEDELRELFSQAGAVSSVALIKDRSSGQFAFIEMESQAEAQKAISMFHEYTLNERQLTVNFARPREERSGFQGRDRNQKRGGGNRRF